MMITLILYLIIIIYIIIRSFYASTTKATSTENKIKLFTTSISFYSLPFYMNISFIYLLCIFINLIFISSFFLPNLINDFLNNNVAYCQDNNEENQSYLFSKKDGSFYKKTQFYIYKY